MSICRKPLARRTVLRGLGTAVALPLLEAMLPTARAAETSARPKRLQVFYTPNGMIMQSWRPAAAGAGFPLSPTLAPLAPFKQRLTVISGLAHSKAVGPGGHGSTCPAFLTGATARPTEGADLLCGPSMDQVVAAHLAQATPLASLELGIDPPSLLGSCDINYSCTYTNTLSWRSPTVAVPVTVNPRDVFERLFGDGQRLDEQGRALQARRRRSILDFVREDASQLAARVGTEDRRKLDQYLESVRDIERRIQAAGGRSSADAGDFAPPAGIPDSFDEHAGLMIDLSVLAMQADMTRVGTFMLGRELSNRSYPEVGVADAHHMLSHHGGDPEKIARLVRINTLHMTYLARLLERLSTVREGEGTLLDSTMVLGGCAFGEPNDHDALDLPILLAGGGVPGDRHLVVPKLTPMANLMLAMMQALGVEAQSFGDSTGPLSGVMA